MVKCPDGVKEHKENKKKWKYGRFDVEAYACSCGRLQGVHEEGKHSYTLKKSKKTKGWKKT